VLGVRNQGSAHRHHHQEKQLPRRIRKAARRETEVQGGREATRTGAGVRKEIVIMKEEIRMAVGKIGRKTSDGQGMTEMPREAEADEGERATGKIGEAGADEERKMGMIGEMQTEVSSGAEAGDEVMLMRTESAIDHVIDLDHVGHVTVMIGIRNAGEAEVEAKAVLRGVAQGRGREDSETVLGGTEMRDARRLVVQGKSAEAVMKEGNRRKYPQDLHLGCHLEFHSPHHSSRRLCQTKSWHKQMELDHLSPTCQQ